MRFSREVGVVHHPGPDPDPAVEPGRVATGVLQGQPRQLQQESLLRVQDLGLTGRDREQRRVELVGVLQDAAGGDILVVPPRLQRHARVELGVAEEPDGLVPVTQVSPQRLHVGRVGETARQTNHRDLVTGRGRLRAWATSPARLGEVIDAARAPIEERRQIGWGRALEELHDRKVVPPQGQAAGEAERDQRGASQLEEVVAHADGRDVQQLAPQRADLALELAPRRDVGLIQLGAGRGRRGERAPIDLAAGGARQAVHEDERRRHHVVRQLGREVPAQRRGAPRLARRRDHVGDEALLGPTLGIAVPGHHRHLGDAGVLAERDLDLAQLDPEATDLHLAVAAPEKLKVAVRQPRARSPVLYMRAFGEPANGSGTKRSLVRSGRPT